MREEAILTTLTELDRWKRKRDALRAELARADQQVGYYEALVRDMKREVQPPRLLDLLKAMQKF